MFSYLSLFLFLFGIVDGSLVDLAVERPGISVLSPSVMVSVALPAFFAS